MTTNVDPEEAEALRELLEEEPGAAQAEVLDRNFRQPLRLGGAELVELSRGLQVALSASEKELHDLIGTRVQLELGSIGEINSQLLFDDTEGPFAACCFEALGQPAWIQWETVPAINTIETVLGASSTTSEARRMSPIECSILLRVFGILADSLLRSLNIEGGNLRIAQTREALGTWRDATAEPDPYRIHIELPFEGPGPASVFHIYMPMSRSGPGTGSAPGANAATSAPLDLPIHLSSVEIDVGVSLGGCDIQLDQLLELEEGDVIPLEARVGDSAILSVEGTPFAKGTLGRRQENIAIRIEQLEHESEQPQ